ncbi:hypothetical protein CBR_g38491 [Chara braunii]|uniref:S-acyltransferase n=1 Tax=Chara braunii TaxID=69332 RepID=A0A388JNV2_CHABU|nr:hypothetical protein CBR_g38491 [Chara braunii]|eukprot:GBG59467.1 hypothetical protein CBR_g38491 [Chara braunii]
MRLEKFLSLPVIVVFVLFGFVYYTVIFLALDPWIGLYTANGVLNASLFTGWVVMGLIAYACAVGIDPGAVPPDWTEDAESGGSAVHEVKRKSGEARFCQKCHHYKPPRTHHCRLCHRCVLRMDHHCVWINNCVGHRNYKSFFLFVLYVVAGCAHAVVLLVGDILYELQLGPEQEAGAGGTDQTKLEEAAGSTGLLTLTKHHEGVKAKWVAQTTGEEYRHPYDLGVFHNIHAVLGPNSSCWLCPFPVSHVGTGLKFEVAKTPFISDAETSRMAADSDDREAAGWRTNSQFDAIKEQSKAWGKLKLIS